MAPVRPVDGGPVIRPLEVDEWSRYRAVRLAALRESPAAFGSTADDEVSLTEAAWRRRLAGRVQLVAELDDGEIVGTLGVLDEGDAIAELVSMWVAPPWRGRGIGDGLVAAALERAEARGASVVRLWVGEGNEPAQRLYARHGFRRTGFVQPVRADDPDDPRMEQEMRHEGG